MTLKAFDPNEEEGDKLVLDWLNMLSAREMDNFFWDYPVRSEYGVPGGGLGLKASKSIVERRGKRPGGLKNIAEVQDVPGVGQDKINDMRIQAREALALAAYYDIPRDPARLWRALLEKGPGMPLPRVIEGLKKCLLACRWSLRKEGIKAKHVLLEIPFIDLVGIPKNKGRVSVKKFKRIRLEPWAFAAHRPENRWFLNMECAPGARCDITLDGGD